MKQWKDCLPNGLKRIPSTAVLVGFAPTIPVVSPQEGTLYLRRDRLPGFGVFIIGANLSVYIFSGTMVSALAVATPFAEIAALVDSQNNLGDVT